MVTMADEKLYGIHPVLEALREERRHIRTIFVSGQRRDTAIQRLLSLAERRGIPIITVERAQLQQLVGHNAHQGVAALVESHVYQPWSEVFASLKTAPGVQTLLCLDHVTDVGNFAALIRSAAAFGVRTILLPRHETVAVTPAVAKLSAGAIERVSIVRIGNIVRTLEALKHEGFWVYGADRHADIPVARMVWPERLVLVLGAEGSGMRRLVRQCCDGVIHIPMHAEVDSLNVATAGAILLAYRWNNHLVASDALQAHEPGLSEPFSH
jgi:23S rRNA (guanosine2251-2'-O)-methyltransferase